MKRIIIALTATIGCACIAAAGPAYTLDQLIDSACRNNIAMRDAGRRVTSAAEQRKQAFTNYFPTVSAMGGAFNADKGTARVEVDLSNNLTPELAASLAQVLPAEALAALSQPLGMSMMKNGVVAGVTAVQPVFAGGQITGGNRLARVGEEVARLQQELSRDDVESQTTQYFWQLVSMQDKVKTLDAVDTLLATLHKDVEVALRAGLILRNDLMQVELRQNEVQSQRLKLFNGIALMRMLLAQYCSLSDTTFTLVYDQDVPSPLSVRQDHATALPATPQYRLLDKQVEAARLQEKITLGKYLPTVAIGVGYNYHTLMEKGRSFAMAFATVSIPISGWWGGSHDLSRKRIAVQQSLDEQQDKAQLLTIAMQGAWNNVQESYQQIEIARRSVNQAQENLRLNVNFYHAGTTKMTDLLDAQQLYRQALDSRTDAIAAYHCALTAYRHLTASRP